MIVWQSRVPTLVTIYTQVLYCVIAFCINIHLCTMITVSCPLPASISVMGCSRVSNGTLHINTAQQLVVYLCLIWAHRYTITVNVFHSCITAVLFLNQCTIIRFLTLCHSISPTVSATCLHEYLLALCKFTVYLSRIWISRYTINVKVLSCVTAFHFLHQHI